MIDARKCFTAWTTYVSSLSSLSTTTDSNSQSVHVEELGKHPLICLGAPGNSEGISRFGQEFTPAMENSFANPSDSWGNPPSLVSTSPAIHCMLSAANAVPSGSPFASHALSVAYSSPLSATSPSAASHTPQTVHLEPPEVAVSSASSSTTLYAPNAHLPTIATLPESRRGRSKGSAKIKPRQRLRRPP